jgi:PEP-CTERM motif
MKEIMANALIALVLAWGIPASADVIYDNGTTPSNSFVSDTDFPRFVADDFSLTPGANVITGVNWTGLYFPSNTPTQPDNFTIQFFADVAGSPAVTPFLSLLIGNPGRTDTGIDITGSDLFAYSANVAPIVLAPSTVFWLSIFNSTSADSDDNWFWAMQDALGNSFERGNPADPWVLQVPPVGNRQDFQLTGPRVIPEPAGLALLAIGVIGLLGCRRKQRR